MMKFTKMIAVVATTAFASGLAFAGPELIVDNFDINQGPVTVDGSVVGGPVSSGWQAVSGAGILGGSREMQIVKTAGNASQAISANVSDSVLNYSVDSQARGSGYLRWDGAADNAVGFGLGQDLTSYETVHFLVNFTDAGYMFELGFYTDANTWSIFRSIADSVGEAGSGATWISPQDFTFPLALFNTAFGDPATDSRYVTCGSSGCVDFASVGAIQMVIDPFAQRTALDLTLDKVSVVSEPASAMLGLVGLGALAGIRRRKTA